MKLFLASRFQNSRTIEKLQDYIGGLKGKEIAYIPTASNGENKYGFWKNDPNGSYKFLQKMKAKVKPVVLEDFKNNSVMRELERKDIIWFSGGMTGYLMYWIKRCEIDLNIKRLLERGAVYFGASAGAMVAGKTIDIATFGFVDNERGAQGIKPMNLVDFDIFPHFQDKFLPKIKEKYKGSKLYLLKDGEEIIVEDGKVTVVGEERIITNKK
jgi:dipeptidase E